MQEVGETSKALFEEDEKAVQEILNSKKGHYWIVIAYKPLKIRLKSGQYALKRMIKAYDTKPMPLMGTVVLEAKDGNIVGHEINFHDAPIDWKAVHQHSLGHENPLVQEKSQIAQDYIYNN